LDEKHLIFRNTCESILKNEIESTINPKTKKIEINWNEVFGNENHIRRGQIIERCKDLEYKISGVTIDRRIKDAVDNEILVKDEYGFYSFQ